MKKIPQRNLVRSSVCMIFDEGETIHEHAWPEDFTPPHPDMATLISDPNHEESIIYKHIFQVKDV